MNDIRHDPPNGEFGAGDVDVDGGQAGSFGDEADLVEGSFEAADQHFAVKGGDDNLAVGSFHGSVDNDDVAVRDARVDHGVSIYAHEIGVWFIDAKELFDFHITIFESDRTPLPVVRRENNLF